MTFFRQYIAPLFIVLIFLFALVAVSARAFLPADMAQPAPIDTVSVLPQMPPAIAISHSNMAVATELKSP